MTEREQWIQNRVNKLGSCVVNGDGLAHILIEAMDFADTHSPTTAMTPPTMDDVSCGMRGTVVWFAQQMERELLENDHKTGWEEMSLKWLLNRLKQEVGELEKAIEAKREVVREASDVANFAMMIADNFAHPTAGTPDE